MNKLKQSKCGNATLLLSIGLCMVATQIVNAQATSSMTGRVEDPSGAAIPAANVTATSLETGTERAVASDEAGNYRILSLPVGRYEIKAEKAGFKTGIQTGINLVVGQEAVVTLKLEVGAVQEQVTVTSDAALVNTTTESVSGVVGEEQVKDLPLNGRSFDLLVALNPGVFNYSVGRQGGPGTGGNFFSVSGRRPSDTLTLLNGVEYTGAGNAQYTPAGVSGELLGIDAVREYNVVTETYGAEYGKKAGGQVNVATQTGTNQLHGSMFEFLRNSDLDARNFFDKTIGAPPFKRNQFGGALGGPIRKDKIFIFGNYEGLRQRLAQSDVTFVPDANARLGLLPCGGSGYPVCNGVATGTPVTVPNLDPRMLLYANSFWPAPNGPNLGGGIATSYTNPSQKIQQDYGTARVDDVLSDKDSFYAVYSIDDGVNTTPAASLATASVASATSVVGSLHEIHLFSPQVVNSFTAGISRANLPSVTQPLVAFPSSISFVQGEPGGIGNINFGSSGSQISAGVTTEGTQSAYGPNFTGSHWVRNLFTFADSVQIVRGKHQISAGVWFQRIQANEFDPLRSAGQATFANYPSFFTGVVSTFTIAPKSVEMGWRTWLGAWYLQDSIRLRQNLTLRVGLRHEFSNGFSEVKGDAAHYLFVNDVIQTNPIQGSGFNTANNAKLLLSPRIGLAWDVFGNGKTAIRAGAGTYYDLPDALTYLADTTPPLGGALSISNVPLFSVIPYNIQAPLAPPCSTGVAPPLCNIYSPKSAQSNYKIPTIESWDFTIEQQLTRNTALRLSYTGFQGYHEWLNVDPNSIPNQICANAAGCIAGGVASAATRTTVPQGAQYIPVGTRPNPNLTYGIFVMTEGNQNYNGLEVDFVRRLTKGFQFRGSYTFSKNLDNSSGLVSQDYNDTQTVSDRYDIKRDWGPAGLDVRHQANGNFSYELPFGQGKALLGNAHGVAGKLVSGWQMNGIVTLLSGFPFTPNAGGNISGDGNLNGQDHVSWNPAFSGSLITGTPTQWFNPKAFVLPQVGTFGNVGNGVLRTPGLATVNLSLLKTTHISERFALQFRAEFFNIINRANFGLPNFVVFSGAAISPSAGQVTFTNTTSRQIQMGLKLVF